MVLMVVRAWQREPGRRSGSRGVAAHIERVEPPGWAVRCDITYKHDRTESKKRG